MIPRRIHPGKHSPTDDTQVPSLTAATESAFKFSTYQPEVSVKCVGTEVQTDVVRDTPTSRYRSSVEMLGPGTVILPVTLNFDCWSLWKDPQEMPAPDGLEQHAALCGVSGFITSGIVRGRVHI